MRKPSFLCLGVSVFELCFTILFFNMRRNRSQKPVTAAFSRKRAFHDPFQGCKERPIPCPETARTAGSCERSGAVRASLLSPAFHHPRHFLRKTGHIACVTVLACLIPTLRLEAAHRAYTLFTERIPHAALHAPVQSSASALSFAFRSTTPSPPEWGVWYRAESRCVSFRLW